MPAKTKTDPYHIGLHRFEGCDELGYTYTIKFNQSLVHTGRFLDMCDGMNYPRAKTWLGRVWNALRNH